MMGKFYDDELVKMASSKKAFEKLHKLLRQDYERNRKKFEMLEMRIEEQRKKERRA